MDMDLKELVEKAENGTSEDKNNVVIKLLAFQVQEQRFINENIFSLIDKIEKRFLNGRRKRSSSRSRS